MLNKVTNSSGLHEVSTAVDIVEKMSLLKKLSTKRAVVSGPRRRESRPGAFAVCAGFGILMLKNIGLWSEKVASSIDIFSTEKP